VISIDGSLDSSNANDFQKLVLNGLGEAIRMGGLILNLERLNYASSAGIGSFTVILVETRKRQLPLYLHRMPKSVASVLDLLGFTSFFAFIDDYEARR